MTTKQQINTKTGLVDRYRANGRDCLGKRAFEPIVIADNEDSWGSTGKSFRKVIGRFKLMNKQAGTRFSGIGCGKLDSGSPARAPRMLAVFIKNLVRWYGAAHALFFNVIAHFQFTN